MPLLEVDWAGRGERAEVKEGLYGVGLGRCRSILIVLLSNQEFPAPSQSNILLFDFTFLMHTKTLLQFSDLFLAKISIYFAKLIISFFY